MGKRVHKRCYDIRKIQSQAIMSSTDAGGTRYVDDNFWCISKGNKYPGNISTFIKAPASVFSLQKWNLCSDWPYLGKPSAERLKIIIY